MASSIPQKCTVLVVGGGPGGSFAAAALAREGIDTVVLEGAKFPRYHIGESMLASIRHLLRFIDLDSIFDQYGFTMKPGAAFKLNKGKREGYTDFLAAGGPGNYAWNVIRSEADDLIFRHAGKSGAKIFDGVKVTSVIFDNTVDNTSNEEPSKDNIGRPLRATYTITEANVKGEISFDYIVDASGRAGLLSTKYLKNRRYNQGLKNVANWGYWQGTGVYAPGTPRENAPFFEALQDETGWAWFIPLHDGTTSIGVVMNQKAATIQKAACNHKDSVELYSECLKQAPNIISLIGKGSLSSGIKSASDYSYSASSYAIPYARIVGDAGCFIDPYFSSGVHLALTGGLSAALTICASIRKHCSEASAASWHSQKVADSYTRFLLVVLTAYRQILNQEEAVLSDFDEDNYDRAFALFRPVIQGTADAINGGLTEAELTETLDFCATAFEPVNLKADDAAVVDEICAKPAAINAADYHPDLSPEQIQAVKHIRALQMMRIEDCMHLSSFRTDVIHSYAPIMERGQLGLKKSVEMTVGVDDDDM